MKDYKARLAKLRGGRSTEPPSEVEIEKVREFERALAEVYDVPYEGDSDDLKAFARLPGSVQRRINEQFEASLQYIYGDEAIQERERREASRCEALAADAKRTKTVDTDDDGPEPEPGHLDIEALNSPAGYEHRGEHRGEYPKLKF